MRLQISVVLALGGLWIPRVHSQQLNSANASPADSVEPGATAPRHAVNPAKVSCHGNTLSISANSSTLGSILTQVEKCAGIHIDVPPAAADVLIFDEIGPGSSRDVVSSLLSSSGFNFVLGASSSDPEKIEELVLLARTRDVDAGPADGRRSSPLRSAFAQMRDAARPKPPEVQAAAAAGIEPSDGDAGDSPVSATASGDTDSTATRPDASTADSSDGAASDASSAAASSPKDKSSDEKSTSPAEEKIMNMEKLFEQRRQMIQPSQAPRQTPPQP